MNQINGKNIFNHFSQLCNIIISFGRKPASKYTQGVFRSKVFAVAKLI
jgi:hypothetical protein